MSLLRNLPVLFAWMVAVVLVLFCPALLFVFSLFLILAAPFYRYVVNPVGEESVLPLSSSHKCSALITMTGIGLVKAGIYTGKIPQRQQSFKNILDLSKRPKGGKS